MSLQAQFTLCGKVYRNAKSLQGPARRRPAGPAELVKEMFEFADQIGPALGFAVACVGIEDRLAGPNQRM